MSLSFVGPRGSFEERWIVYALLRDNVQHHLEGGQRTPAFAELYGIAEAIGGPPVKVPAQSLRAQIGRAVDLLDKSIDELAISSRTKTALALRSSLPDDPDTELVRDKMGGVPFLRGTPRTLDEVFGDLVEHLLSITEDALPEDVVEVLDG
jgi:hypothetical protein